MPVRVVARGIGDAGPSGGAADRDDPDDDDDNPATHRPLVPRRPRRGGAGRCGSETDRAVRRSMAWALDGSIFEQELGKGDRARVAGEAGRRLLELLDRARAALVDRALAVAGEDQRVLTRRGRQLVTAAPRCTARLPQLVSPPG